MPDTLAFSLGNGGGAPFKALVKEGDEVAPGQFLADDGARPVIMCPVKGKVMAVTRHADVRGARHGMAVLVEPAKDTSPKAFEKLSPDSEPIEKLRERIEEAGIVTDSQNPRPLAELIGPDQGVKVLVILAADRDPIQNSTLQAFRERIDDTCLAASMLATLAGAKTTMLAASKSVAPEAKKVCDRHNLKVLEISDYYPSSLEPMVGLAAGGSEAVRVVSVETALAALDAVRDGKVQERTMLSVIGAGGAVIANLRVALGTRIKDVLAEAGIKPEEGDKVLAGGPMRGFTQYSLDAPVDQGVDAITHIKLADVVPWSDDPCINCGACVAVCPVKLQAHLLGRYSEFGLFDRAEEFSVLNCIECGLCAAVCTARRPLVQWIRLAKKEVLAARAVREAPVGEDCEPPPEAEGAEKAGEDVTGEDKPAASGE